MRYFGAEMEISGIPVLGIGSQRTAAMPCITVEGAGLVES